MSIDVIYGATLTFRRNRRRNLRREQPELEASCWPYTYRLERLATGGWRATKLIIRSINDYRCERREYPFATRRDAERWCIEDFYRDNPERGRCHVRATGAAR